MRQIAVIGDVHDRHGRLGRTLARLERKRVDLALLVGDIGRDPPWLEPQRRSRRGRHDESVRRVLAHVRLRLKCPVVFVPGNHDLPDPPRDLDGVNCDGRTLEIAGLRLAGLGGAGPARFGFPYEWDEEETDRRLATLLEGNDPPDILICHTPPARTGLDRTYRDEHVGSEAVRKRLAVSRPGLFVCGHIHEGWGIERVEGVPCLNAGALGEPFGQELAWRVRWSHDGRPDRITSYSLTAEGEPTSREWSRA